MTEKFNEVLVNVLRKDLRFVDVDTNELLRNEIVNSALKIDRDLIGLLIKDKEIREAFFDKIEEYYIFNINKFIDYIQDKNFISNSYTKFKNKIGLNIDGKYLNERGEVSLVWAFKDCILEGGMTKEDQKRNEIFFNETLAKDEIDRLFDLKVLTNFKKYTVKGEEKVKDFIKNTKEEIKDNLLIKGNNLLVLHSLKRQFAGRIKLIYIDVPYNTGYDSFKYNDNFSHSTWLTFIKNRLEIAKLLLREDGVIFVHCDDNEQAYLKVLMDEIFGRERFVSQIVWKRKGGHSNSFNKFENSIDYILFYGKSENYDFNPIYELNSDHVKKYIEERFNNIDEKTGKRFMKSPLVKPHSANKNTSLKYDYKGYKHPEFGWSITRENMEKLDSEGKLCFPANKNQRISKKIFLDEYLGQPVNNLWSDIFVINPMAKESLEFVGQKPEKLIQRILKISAHKGDIVLDSFGGSGTTASTCHKMGLQYISIEQIDCQIDIMLKRLKKVIGKESSKGKLSATIQDYDDTGISTDVNWKGGGEFIYCELMKYNEEAIERIQDAKDTKSLIKIWEEMCDKYFLKYNVEIKKFNGNKEEFEKLNLMQQKRILIEMLNKNQLYVNLSEINDSQFNISREDKDLNKKFYGEK